MGFLSKLLTMGEGKQLKRYQAKVDKINALEPEFQALSDEELAAKTQEFRERYAAGESLDDLLPEAFAAVREASVRTIGLRHFDVQLIGGMALNEGQIAEMKTGEGKTLVSTLAGYLNAIPGHNVHIVTVNDYLARRDCEWMGQIYRFLGMKTGLIQNGMPPTAKKPAYEADVTYGTNSEFGFDYLRDNMVTRGSSRVQRGHHFAIVDEVDSILIDEARTPLIISGAGTQAADTYKKFARVMPGLKEGVDFDMDEAKRTINATESGLEKIEVMLGIENIYADPSGQLANHLQQALKAQFLFHRDVDYVVMDGEVKIVDEFTGRIMEGRRYSEGLHQALEAKEHVLVREENQTLATITLQNYFRLYDKLSGMTGTAMTEDAEFRQIYKLPVMAIPPNRPVIRVDENDLVYRTIDGKFNAVADDIAARHAKGQPCLIGTVSIENSEKLSRLLDKRGIKHETLNAKHHEREAHIVAQAGRLGAVTIATNMAGRGTDIRLGGEPDMLAEDLLRERGFDVDAQEGDEEARGPIPSAADRADALTRAREICDAEQEQVLAAGGLCVIGTERHESRRIDNQLRGRAGRQGDPGESRFYIALTDDVMRLFGSERMQSMMETLRVDEDTPLDHKMLSNAIEQAQRTVESRNFQARKNVLEYDDVMNVQRNVIYEERRKVLDGEDLQEHVQHMIRTVITGDIAAGMAEHHPENDKDLHEILAPLEKLFPCDLSYTAEELHKLTPDTLADAVYERAMQAYAAREESFGLQPDGTPLMRELERVVMLRVVDEYWMDHLEAMDDLRQGIGLRAYGNVKPVDEYKRAGFDMFDEMVNGIQSETVRRLFTVRVRREQKLERKTVARGAATNAGGDDSEKKKPVRRVKKPGRNDPCPCGKLRPNGLPMKYKDCCGKNA